MLKGPPKAIEWGIVSKISNLEMIHEVASSKEQNEIIQEPLPQDEFC